MDNSNYQVAQDIIKKWSETSLTDAQEKHLDSYVRLNAKPGADIEELKKKARIAYYLQAVEPSLMSRKEKEARIAKGLDRTIELNEEQQAVKFTSEELKHLIRLGVNEDNARFHAERLRAEEKEKKYEAEKKDRNKVWSNILQRYVPKEEK